MHINDEVIKQLNGLTTKGLFEVHDKAGNRLRLNGLESWRQERNIRASAEKSFYWCLHSTSKYKYLRSIGNPTNEDCRLIIKELVDELFASGELTIHQIK